jgi:hypothetical protein
MIIEIYNHPDYPSLKRQADSDLTWFCVDGLNQKVIMEVIVDTLDPDDNIMGPMRKSYSFTADNNTRVNAQGIPVPALLENGEPNPEAVMGEWDFFKIVKGLRNNPSSIDDMIQAKIQWAASIERFS